jgi:hypothetical protein
MSAISQALAHIGARLLSAAERSGRDPSEIKLVAVSKTFPPEAVQDAIDAQQLRFGENRVEEALPKLQAVSKARPATPCEWHLIGHLQSRKARDAARHFALIHSVDSLKLAEKIARVSPQPQAILLQCNVSGEASKDGFDLSDWQQNSTRMAAFCDTVRQIQALPALHIRGLMTLAPIVPDPDLARPTFAALRNLRELLRERFPDNDTHSWHELSMGMTDDFEAAIAEGATYIRIGRAIFGGRTSAISAP